MAYPSAIDSYTPPSGTSLLTNPDHSGQHASFGSAITNIENKLGVGSGSAAANQLLVGSGAGTAQWGSVVNNLVLGTPSITNGAITGGTLIGGLAATGGTINNVTLGTPTITGFALKPVFMGTTIATGTTAGTSYTDLLIGTIVIGFTANIQITINAPLDNNSGSNINLGQILRGTAPVGGTDIYMQSTFSGFSFNYAVVDSNVAAGTYTYHWQWHVTAGTATITNPTLNMLAFPA